MRVLLAVLTLCLLTPESVSPANLQGPEGNKYIDALVSASNLPTYTSDGAADTSVVAYDMNDPRTAEHHIPAVLDLVNLRSKAIPLLIACLDDTRPTSAKYAVFSPRFKGYINVPVGYICLDLLINITKDTPHIFRKNCVAGLNGCVRKEFAFLPDSYTRRGKKYIASPKVHRVKLRWQQAYRKGRVKYQYPAYWKQRI